MCQGRGNSISGISCFLPIDHSCPLQNLLEETLVFANLRRLCVNPLSFENYLRKITELKCSGLYTRIRTIQWYQSSFLGSSCVKALCEPLKFQNYLRKITELKCSGLYTRLRTLHSHIFNPRMGVGSGTNTFAELLALWGILWFAKKKILSRFLFLATQRS